MTLVMLIVGIIIGMIMCVGLIALGLTLAMLFDKDIRHDTVKFWDEIDEKYGW